MLNQTALATIQKYILLATGVPASSALRDQIFQLYDQTGDLSQVAVLVDDFMTQQMLQHEKGANGVLQAIVSNGLSLNLTDLEADQLVTDFIAQGIDSWSKLFAFLTTDVVIELGTILNNRAEAANLFTDLLAERNLDGFHNNSQATNAAREWLVDIDASNESLVNADSIVSGLINRFFIETVELSALEQNDNNDGFAINGVSAFDRSGESVSSAGDVNGDGLADLIIGASGYSPEGIASGASFVVFGKSDGTVIELSDVNSGIAGFSINGESASDGIGESVSSAGDVNGDGLADLIVGARFENRNGPFAEASFVVFGKNNNTAIDFSTVESGYGGFVINSLGVGGGDLEDEFVGSAGDVNGDGLADLIVGAPINKPNGNVSGASFVVFGKDSGTAIELSDVESGNGGFVINGVNTYDRSGSSVSGAGDVDGDGLADLIVGARFDGPNGQASGASFVVFGKSNGAQVEL